MNTSDIQKEIAELTEQMQDVENKLTGCYNLEETQKLLDEYSGLQARKMQAGINLTRLGKFPNAATYPAKDHSHDAHSQFVIPQSNM